MANDKAQMPNPQWETLNPKHEILNNIKAPSTKAQNPSCHCEEP